MKCSDCFRAAGAVLLFAAAIAMRMETAPPGAPLVYARSRPALRVSPEAESSAAYAHSSQGSSAPNVSAGNVNATRIALTPRLQPGDMLRYRIEFQTTSQTTHGGAIQDPQGPSQVAVTWEATVRLEVLEPQGSAGLTDGEVGTSGGKASSSKNAKPIVVPSIRLRSTYEKSSATVVSDTPDPAAEGIEKQYAQLEGQSIEFSLGSDGHISNVRGLEGVTDEKARTAAEQWASQLSRSSSTPAGGVVPGQKWTSDEAADSLPLAGLVWHTDYTYLRNELCRAVNPGGNAPKPGGESCALILSRLSLATPHPVHDATPQDYRRNGLRTSGHWTASGESLSYVSLNKGWVVSVTQNGTEQMDIAVVNADGNTVHYAGTVRTQSDVSLLPPESPAPQSPPEVPPRGTSQIPARP